MITARSSEDVPLIRVIYQTISINENCDADRVRKFESYNRVLAPGMSEFCGRNLVLQRLRSVVFSDLERNIR